MKQCERRRRLPATAAAFTIAELMVVIGIIAVLVAILIPAISKVRQRAHATDTANFISQLQAAINSYEQMHKAYPGPIPDYLIANTGAVATDFGGATGNFDVQPTLGTTGYDPTPGNLYTQITGSENLVLGLLGGLRAENNPSFLLHYDPTIVGTGPRSLNASNPKKFEPLLDAAHLSWRSGALGKTGQFADASGTAVDTLIPEFVDTFPGAEMPILYLRAKRGVAPIITLISDTNNSVMTWVPAPTTANPRRGTYDVQQIWGYTSTLIGEGKRISEGEYKNVGSLTFPRHGLQSVGTLSTTKNPPPSGLTYQYPYSGFAYFQDPSVPNTARAKDSYILISAGPDRVYGTRDDIVSFGSVGE